MNNYVFDFQKMKQDKKDYRQVEARINALPKDYKFVFNKIQKYMWDYCSGYGIDMVNIHIDLLDMFEAGVAEGKKVLEITGEDVASFADELLTNARTYIGDRHEKLNREIAEKLNKDK